MTCIDMNEMMLKSLVDDGCVGVTSLGAWPFPKSRHASTTAEFERELSAERIPVGDAQEVDFDAGTKFYGPLGGMKPGRTFRVAEGWNPVDPMCAAMSQPVDPFYQAVTLLMRGEARAAAKRCLADDLATRDFFKRGPKPAEAPERAPERAKPPLAGFDVVHEGRWHL
jgi:hypothetical protein